MSFFVCVCVCVCVIPFFALFFAFISDSLSCVLNSVL